MVSVVQDEVFVFDVGAIVLDGTAHRLLARLVTQPMIEGAQKGRLACPRGAQQQGKAAGSNHAVHIGEYRLCHRLGDVWGRETRDEADRDATKEAEGLLEDIVTAAEHARHLAGVWHVRLQAEALEGDGDAEGLAPRLLDPGAGLLNEAELLVQWDTVSAHQLLELLVSQLPCKTDLTNALVS